MMAPAVLRAQDGELAIPARCAPRPRADLVRAGLIGLGLYEIVAGFPSGSEELPRALRTSRRDSSRALQQATVELSFGVASLAAVRQRSWRAPMLALGSLSWLLRAVARGAIVRGHGKPAPSHALPAAAAGTLAWLFSRATRAERWQAG
jgi:hypothetical protein